MGLVIFKMVYLLLCDLCFFKIQVSSILFHLRPKMTDNRSEVSPHDVLYLCKALRIVLFTLLSFAWTFAIAKMVFKAYFEFTPGDVTGSKIEIACAQLNCCLDEIEEFPNLGDRSEGTQVF